MRSAKRDWNHGSADGLDIARKPFTWGTVRQRLGLLYGVGRRPPSPVGRVVRQLTGGTALPAGKLAPPAYPRQENRGKMRTSELTYLSRHDAWARSAGPGGQTWH